MMDSLEDMWMMAPPEIRAVFLKSAWQSATHEQRVELRERKPRMPPSLVAARTSMARRLNAIERESPEARAELDALRDAFNLPKEIKRGYPAGPERHLRYRDPSRNPWRGRHPKKPKK
jgi:hypothetical protein